MLRHSAVLATAFAACVCAAALVACEAARANGPVSRQLASSDAGHGERALKGIYTYRSVGSRSSTPIVTQAFTLSFQVQPSSVGPLTAASSSNTTQSTTQRNRFMDNLRADLLSSKLGDYAKDVLVSTPQCQDIGVCQSNMVQVHVGIYVKCNSVSSLRQVIDSTAPSLKLLSMNTTSTHGLLSMHITPSPSNTDVKNQVCGSSWLGVTTNSIVGVVVGVVFAVALLVYGLVRFIRWRRQQAAQAGSQPPITGSPAAPGAAGTMPGYPYPSGQNGGLQLGTIAYVTPGAAPQVPKVEAYPYPQPAASPVPGYPQYSMPPAPMSYTTGYAVTAPAYPAAATGAGEQDPYTAAAAAMRAELAAGGGYPSAGQPPAAAPPSNAPVSGGAVTYYKGWGN